MDDLKKSELEQVKQRAVAFAESSEMRDCLYRKPPEDGQHDEDRGDWETLQTIASLVTTGDADLEYNDPDEIEDIVLAYIESRFPDYVDGVEA